MFLWGWEVGNVPSWYIYAWKLKFRILSYIVWSQMSLNSFFCHFWIFFTYEHCLWFKPKSLQQNKKCMNRFYAQGLKASFKVIVTLHPQRVVVSFDQLQLWCVIVIYQEKAINYRLLALNLPIMSQRFWAFLCICSDSGTCLDSRICGWTINSLKYDITKLNPYELLNWVFFVDTLRLTYFERCWFI